MRDNMRIYYEKNEKNLNKLYIWSLICLFVIGKLKDLKEETKSTMLDHLGDISFKDEKIKKIYKEIIVFRLIYHIRPGEYFLYDIKNKSYKDRLTFMPREFTNKYYRKINDPGARHIYDNKLIAYKVFKDYYKRDIVSINTEDDYELFKQFCEGKKDFILKPISGHSGEGIRVIKIDKDIKKIFKETLTSIPYIVEELIVQDETTAAFHPQSLNTVRVVTFQLDGKVSLLWSFMRTGQGESKVDNMGSGGLGAQIDVETGKIITDAIDWKGSKVKVHPDSKVKFKGYQYKDWDLARKMVKELAAKVPAQHCVGWDLALTGKGWVIVEGNGRPQCVTIQTLTQKGYKPVYDAMMKLCINDNSKKEVDE